MKFVTSTMLFFCIFFHISDILESQTLLADLKIGDTVPDIRIDGLVNRNGQNLQLKDLYSKGLLIIDFWATWCAPCVTELPVIDSFARMYARDMRVLAVSHDTDKVTKAFFLKRADLKLSNLDITTNDTLLSRLFPHKLIPHNVWIDRNGVIRSITSQDELTSENIKRTISGNTTPIANKHDAGSFDFDNTFHVDDSSFVYRSIISKYADSISSGVLYHPNGYGRRFFGWNRDITEYFWLAYTQQQSTDVNWKLVELHTDDSTKYFQPSENWGLFLRSRYHAKDQLYLEKQHWEKDNFFCYELALDREVSNKLFCRYMMDDLGRCFHLKGYTKKKKVEAIVIGLNKNPPILQKSTCDSSIIVINGDKLLIRRKSLVEIGLYLFDVVKKGPFVNKTGIDYPLDFDIDLPGLRDGQTVRKAMNWETIQRGFNRYGLNFKPKKVGYPILVLDDIGTANK